MPLSIRAAGPVLPGLLTIAPASASSSGPTAWPSNATLYSRRPSSAEYVALLTMRPTERRSWSGTLSHTYKPITDDPSAGGEVTRHGVPSQAAPQDPCGW